MLRAVSLATLLIVVGCAPGPRQGDWLVGGWVLEGDSCESDAGVEYHPDGTWQAYGTGGQWRLVGDRLESTITERWEDEGEPSVSVAPPERFAETVTPLGPDRYRAKNGDERVLVRCPTTP